MKEYLVTLDEEIFIVLAKNAKDAISQVWEKEIKYRNESLKTENTEAGYYLNHIWSKSELNARSLASLHNENGKIIYL